MQTSQVALDLRVSFFLRKSYVNEEGKNPIILRTGYRGENRDTFTNYFIHSANWLPGVGRVSRDEPKAAIINTRLDDITREAKDHFDQLKYSRQEFSIDELVQKIRGKDQVPETLMDYVEETIKDYQLRVGVDMSLATFYKYQRVKNYLIDFLSTSRKVKNLPISRVDDRLLHQFFLFLRKEKQNNNNSALTLLNFLKTVLLQPLKRQAHQITR